MESAAQYLRKNGIAQLLDELVGTLIEERPEDPKSFLASQLESAPFELDPPVPQENDWSQKRNKFGPNQGPAPQKISFTRQRTFNWKAITAKLPAGRTSTEKAKREQLFSGLDVNGNHYLSLAEVDKGLRDIIQLDSLFDCKPAIMRAFQAAKRSNAASRAALGDDYVTKSEFRLLLVYLRRYFELFVMFDRIDTNDDRRLSFGEFEHATKLIESWGVHVYYPEQQFKSIDKDGAGMILFTEFAEWAIQQQLDLEDDDDDTDEAFASGGAAAGGPNKGVKAVFSSRRVIDWKKISATLPSGRSKLEESKRNELFHLFDVNGNKYLSLAEVDKGLRDIVRLDDVFDCKPAIMRAFQAAKNANPGSRAARGVDYVTRSEFRVLMEYLKRYFELFVMFDKSDPNDDRRLSKEEFLGSVEQLQKWGLPSDVNAEAEFNAIDKNGGGMLLFDEYAEWALRRCITSQSYE